MFQEKKVVSNSFIFRNFLQKPNQHMDPPEYYQKVRLSNIVVMIVKECGISKTHLRKIIKKSLEDIKS